MSGGWVAEPAEPRMDADLGSVPPRIEFVGTLMIAQIGRWQELAGRLDRPPVADGEIVFDLTRTERLDTAGAWFLLDLRMRLEGEGATVRIEFADPSQIALIEVVESSLPEVAPPDPPERGLVPWLAVVGKATIGAWTTAIEMSNLLGGVVTRLSAVLLRPWRLRWISLVHHMQAAGLDAVPIVSLMSFLIGIVLAFQGAVQLRQFGAEIFVVDLLAISILRELGVLLTAIIVAGRSGSAFTAAIGSMKMSEEIDAMRTLGLDPVSVLVLPRVLSLVLMLPVLAFIADISGLVGGALMAWAELGISPGMFTARLWDETDVWNFVIGIVKAPFFAVTIALVGCYEGLKVEGNAESLGSRTSRSVVEAIFLVIVMDAIFSVFFATVGL